MPSILIVDDDAPVRRTLEKMLESAGFETVSAADGSEGLELFRRRRPDLVVTDIIMPNEEGLGLIRDLRNEDPGVRILAISGGSRLGTLDFLRMARSLGAADTLAKPFEKEEFLTHVRRCLGTPTG